MDAQPSPPRSVSAGSGRDDSRIVDTLDRGGVHFAIVGRDGTIRWASPGLERSRGAVLGGLECHAALFRRRSDTIPCRREEVLASGVPHRCWIPERRPGRFGRRQMLVQMKAGEDEILEVFVDTGSVEDLFLDQIFRERVMAEGLRHVSAGVFLLDAELRIVTANPAAVALTGLQLETLRGREFPELLPAGTFPERGPGLARLLATRASLEVDEVRLPSPKGDRWVRVSVAVVPTLGGAAAAAVAILGDVTPERRASEALERKLEEISLLREVDHVLARTVRMDQVLRVILAAAVHPRGLGLQRCVLFLRELPANSLRGRLARTAPEHRRLERAGGLGLQIEALAAEPVGEDDQQLEQRVQRFSLPVAGGENVLSAALLASRPTLLRAPQELRGGRELVDLLGGEQIVLAPLATQGRKLGVLAGVFEGRPPASFEDLQALAGMIAATAAGAIERARLHDELAGRLADLREAHTRLRHLQGQLLRAEHMSALGELAAEIVHQIRNPLAVIGGFARRLSRRTGAEDPRSEDLRILVEETERIETILERIRHDVRLARSAPHESVRPEDVVGAAVERYEQVAGERAIELRAELEDALPEVRASREVMLEVLDNLLRNAFDATGEGGRVCVRAQRLREAVHITVEDDGPGLGEEQAEKIFEPFYTTKDRGTGLGLPLSRRLLRQCGGSLSVDPRPGRGARFRIVLPAIGQGPSGGEEGSQQWPES